MTETKAAPWANDATDLSPAPPASRGAQLLGLTISFGVKLPASLWKDVGPAVGYPEWDPARQSLLFYGLPVQVAELVPYISGDVHMHAKDGSEAHWQFYWERALSNEPPERIRQGAKVPYPEIMDRLAEAWPSSEPFDAVVTGSYLVLVDHWRFPASAPSKLGKGLPLLRPSGWTLDPPSGVVGHVSTRPARASDDLVVTAGGRCTIRMTKLFFNQVDGLLWNGLSRILKPSLSRTRRTRRPAGGKAATP